MELTVAAVWPGAPVSIGGQKFRVAAERTPSVWLRSPRGIELHATVCSNLSRNGVTLPYPGRFERTQGRWAKPYSIGGLDVWGYGFSVPKHRSLYLALWYAGRATETWDMPHTHAIAEVRAVLDAGGDQDAASFQAGMGHGVAVRWDLQPFPPFREYIVGSGWSYLPGYWQHQTELSRARADGASR